MKITKLECLPVHSGWRKNFVFVKIETDAGITGWGIVCGAASFAGGLGMALRKWYWLARLGSALAVVNFAGCCCVPGAFVGVWSWMLLRSDEGREHFA